MSQIQSPEDRCGRCNGSVGDGAGAETLPAGGLRWLCRKCLADGNKWHSPEGRVASVLEMLGVERAMATDPDLSEHERGFREGWVAATKYTGRTLLGDSSLWEEELLLEVDEVRTRLRDEGCTFLRLHD
jgi:hypothetical protein